MTFLSSELNNLRYATVDPVLRHALNPILVELLPGGTLFSELELEANPDVLVFLDRIDEKVNNVRRSKAPVDICKEPLISYLSAIETSINTISITEPLHRKLLLCLKLLLPPETPLSPHVFIVSGPSGTGKDTVLKLLLEMLHSRGYVASIFTKFVTRSDRFPEKITPSLFRYQMHVTKLEFESLFDAGEIVCKYSLYENDYGFSNSEILNMASQLHARNSSATGKAGLISNSYQYTPILFSVMSMYDQVETFAKLILEGCPEAVVTRVLLSADSDICTSRLAERITAKPLNDEELIRGYGEFRIRSAQIKTDAAALDTRSSYSWNFSIYNNKRDGGMAAANDFYRRVLRTLDCSRPTIASS